MSAPKSVIKMKKDGIVYESSVDKANYFLFELSRAAMRDVGKFCKRKFRESYYSNFVKRSGDGPKALYTKVEARRNTLYPRVEMGLPHAKKGRKVVGFYSFFQEFGSSKTPRLQLLTHVVQDNIAEIVKIESQYLSALEDEAKALAMIDESEYEDEDDE